jgi:hypothetical protein
MACRMAATGWRSRLTLVVASASRASTPTPTPTSMPIDTPSPTSTPASTITLTPTSTPTDTPSPTTIPSETPTYSDTAAICRSVSITTRIEQADEERTRLEVTIASEKPLLLSDFGVRAYRNADEREPELTLAHLDGTVMTVWAGSQEEHSLWMAPQVPIDVAAPGVVINAVYRHSLPIALFDDSYRLRYIVDGIECSDAGLFSDDRPVDDRELLMPQLSIIAPAQDDATVTAEAAAFEATASAPTYVELLAFRVYDEQGRQLWAWNEYRPKYCAFGSDDQCQGAPQSWWNGLPNGRYRLAVTAYAGRGIGVTGERWFIK